MWYSYGKLHGWEELFYRFYEAGYAVTKTWQIWSESRQRRIALQSSAFFTSIVIVARPNAKRKPLLGDDDHEFVEDVKSTVASSMNAIIGSYGMDLLREALVVSIADGFAAVTRYTLPASSSLTQAHNYRRLANKALEVSVNTVMELLASRVGIQNLDIKGLDPTSRLYLFLLIASDERLRVPYDFSNRVYQVLRAPSLEIIQQNKESEGILTLRPPDAMATLGVRIGKAAELVRSVRETIARYGVRAAEEMVAQADRNDVVLAYYLTAICWKKLGIGDSGERDRVLRVLGGGL
jgi:adenine-specific DNA methylase